MLEFCAEDFLRFYRNVCFCAHVAISFAMMVSFVSISFVLFLSISFFFFFHFQLINDFTFRNLPSKQATNTYCSNAACTLCASFDDIFSQFITIMIRISRFSMCKCMNSFFVRCYFSSFFVVVLFFHNLWRIFTHE